MKLSLFGILLVTACTVLTGPAVASPLLVGGDPDPNFSELKVWYDAGSLALADGASITTWNSSAATANAATVGTTGREPTYIASGLNGLPAVQFDGIDDQLIMSTNVFNTGPLTYFLVFQSTDTQGHIIGTGSSSAGFLTTFGSGLIVDQTAGVKATSSGNPSRLMLQAVSTDYSAGSLITAVAMTGANSIAVNGNTEATDATDFFPFNYSRATLGASDGSANGAARDPFGGAISEVLVYGELTPSEIDEVGSYLQEKYDIIPEPASLALLGLSGLALLGRRRHA